jgi:AcrR family transcriptional regulator
LALTIFQTGGTVKIPKVRRGTFKMSKKQQLAEFNANNILSAAKILFYEKGVVQTTMDDIAKKSEYSKSTIYTYFESKDEIFHYIVLEYFTLLKNGIEEALRTSTDFPESYFAICNTVAKFYSDYPMYFECVLGEIKISEDKSGAVLFKVHQVGEKINDMLEIYLKICRSNGSIREFDSPPQATFALWCAICGIISLANKKEKYIRYKMNASKEEFLQNGFELLLKSIRSSI